MTRRDLLMRGGQPQPIALGGNLSRSMMSSSLPALPIPSDQFYDIVETTNQPTMQVSVRKGEHGADALYGPGGVDNIVFENGIPGMKHQKKNPFFIF